ncbi:MAG: hypothetical protein JSS37_10380 [Proteobacteria bacterium]|nr:hypothetical protein [Pseudomonadota bacterium]
MGIENESDKKEQIRKKRQAIDLYRRVLEARDRWLKCIQPDVIAFRSVIEKDYRLDSEDDPDEDNFSVKGESTRSQKKTLYLVPPKVWSKVAKKELETLRKELAAIKNKGLPISRKLWLPTVIEDANEVVAKIHEAKSVRKVPLETARKFAKKAGLNKKEIEEYLNSKDSTFWIKTMTGKKYKLNASNVYGSKDYAFTDWAVCLCDKETIPILKKRKKNKLETADDNTKIIICSHGNSTLYMEQH